MEKKSKKSIIIGITCLTLVTLLLLGLTYAYYRTRIVGNPNNESIHVVTKKLGISYVDNQAVITAKGIEPGYNNEANPKTFTVHNTGDEAGTFNIIIDNVVNEFTKGTATRGEYNDWTYELYEGTTISSDKLLKSGEITSEEKQVLINNITIEAQEEITYTLIIRYAELVNVDQSDDMGLKLSIRVNIEEGTLKENPMLSSPSGTLLYALNANKPSGSEETIPGQEASTSNEARMVETEDDYGTSYVYRGNVVNNYVTYSNMCWRIVRIDGNGNIKLALADGAHPCGTANGYSATDTDSAFTRIVDNASEFPYLSYKTYSDAKYDETDIIFETSDIPQELSTWAEGNNLDMSELVEAEWCNDTSIVKDRSNGISVEENGDEIWVDNKEEAEYWFNNYEYGAAGRLDPVESAEPSLICNQKGLFNSEALVYINKLGILNVDEVAFAGGIYEKKGNSYLNFNTSSSSYWTLTPYQLELAGAVPSFMFVIDESGIKTDDAVSDYGHSVRPSVVLRSEVLLSTNTSYIQDGTIDNPYVIS